MILIADIDKVLDYSDLLIREIIDLDEESPTLGSETPANNILNKIFKVPLEINKVLLLNFTDRIITIKSVIDNLKNDIERINSETTSHLAVKYSKIKDPVEKLDILLHINEHNSSFNIDQKIKIKLINKASFINKDDTYKSRSLEEYLNNEEITFISELTSTCLINKVLINFAEVTGYRNSKFNWPTAYVSDQLVRIEDIKNYYEYWNKLTTAYPIDINAISIDLQNPPALTMFLPDQYSTIFQCQDPKENWSVEHNHLFSDTFEEFTEGKKRKVLLLGGDAFLSNKFVEEAQDELDDMLIYNCSDGSYKLFPNKKIFALTNIDKLSETLRQELSRELSDSNYNSHQIILQSSSLINSISFKGYEKVYVPTFEQCSPFLYRFFFLMSLKNDLFSFIGDKTLDYYRGEYYYFCSKVFNDALIKTTSLSTLNYAVDFLTTIPDFSIHRFNADFVSDFEHFVNEQKIFSLPTQGVKQDSLKLYLTIIHSQTDISTSKPLRIVDKLSQKEYSEEYEKCLPILYIIFIKKYSEISGDNKIDSSRLYKLVKEYQNKKTGERKSGQDQTIREAINNYFRPNNNLDHTTVELKQLIKNFYVACFKIEKDFSYYNEHPHFMVTIEDEEMAIFLETKIITKK